MVRKPSHSTEGHAASCRSGLRHKAVLGNRKRNTAKGRFLLGNAEQNLKGIYTEWGGVLTLGSTMREACSVCSRYSPTWIVRHGIIFTK